MSEPERRLQRRTRAPTRARSGDAGRGAVRAAAAGGASQRKVSAGVRRQAILEAALTVFAARGYEAVRLDDVAAQAGVAKGTLYLYFKDKQALFEELVRGAVGPIMARIGSAALAPEHSASQVIDMFFQLFQRDVLDTKRKLLLRLIIAEGPRFPAIAAFYHREVVARGMTLLRKLASEAAQPCEFPSGAPRRYPQLIVAPLLLAVIWDGLFSKIEPLDVAGLLAAHRDLLSAGAGKTAP